MKRSELQQIIAEEIQNVLLEIQQELKPGQSIEWIANPHTITVSPFREVNPGDIGRVTKHGSDQEYWVIFDGLEFSARLGKDFKIKI